jgi:glycosyltransferase involved in cell wall biosynthesis
LLGKLSDVIITSSQINYDLFCQYNSCCGLFENAVDEKFISHPSELPHRLKNDGPRLGYVGWITERTDLALLEHIARERPNYHLLIAGPLDESQNMEKILSLKNSTYLGVMPYEDVPGFLRTLDVCLIPHRDTAYSRSMSPLKLYQYLASGRPIVTTLVAGIERFSGLVSVANNYDEFLRCVDQNLHEDNVLLSARRIEMAKKEAWPKRTRDIFEYVYARYVLKESDRKKG